MVPDNDFENDHAQSDILTISASKTHGGKHARLDAITVTHLNISVMTGVGWPVRRAM